jgi:hypothetical protein
VDGAGGRRLRTALASTGQPPPPAVGGRSTPPFAGRGSRRMADGLVVRLVDGRQGGRPWGRRTWTWMSGCMTTLLET